MLDMGGCLSYHVSFVGKVQDIECEPNQNLNGPCEDDGFRVMSKGSSFVSMHSQKGSKQINQDALIVCKNFTGKRDMVFCGVFDGHGPLGHKVARCVSDKLPSKLSASIKQSQQNATKKHSDANATNGGSNGDDCCEDNQNMSFALWEGIFMKCFSEIDANLSKTIDTDGFRGGCTAVTLIRQGDQLIVGNLGDSRAVLCRRANENLIPVQLTVDLTPDRPREALRVINSGGRIFAAKGDPSVTRVWLPSRDIPGLAMTRAFGNFCLKEHGIISVPEVSYRKLTMQDEFVVLASDGIWDVLTNSEVIDIVASAPKRSVAAKMLVNQAIQAWRSKYGLKVDDCTAICLFLKD